MFLCKDSRSIYNASIPAIENKVNKRVATIQIIRKTKHRRHLFIRFYSKIHPSLSHNSVGYIIKLIVTLHPSLTHNSVGYISKLI